MNVILWWPDSIASDRDMSAIMVCAELLVQLSSSPGHCLPDLPGRWSSAHRAQVRRSTPGNRPPSSSSSTNNIHLRPSHARVFVAILSLFLPFAIRQLQGGPSPCPQHPTQGRVTSMRTHAPSPHVAAQCGSSGPPPSAVRTVPCCTVGASTLFSPAPRDRRGF